MINICGFIKNVHLSSYRGHGVFPAASACWLGSGRAPPVPSRWTPVLQQRTSYQVLDPPPWILVLHLKRWIRFPVKKGAEGGGFVMLMLCRISCRSRRTGINSSRCFKMILKFLMNKVNLCLSLSIMVLTESNFVWASTVCAVEL